MASSELDGPGPPVECPSCKEELDRDEDDGRYPGSCPFCRQVIRPDLGGPVLECPKCGKKRVKRKKGNGYAPFCGNSSCQYEFNTGEQSGTHTVGSQPAVKATVLKENDSKQKIPAGTQSTHDGSNASGRAVLPAGGNSADIQQRNADPNANAAMNQYPKNIAVPAEGGLDGHVTPAPQGQEPGVSKKEEEKHQELYAEFCEWKRTIADFQNHPNFQQDCLKKKELQAVVVAQIKLDSIQMRYQKALKAQNPQMSKGSEKELKVVFGKMETHVNMWSKPNSLIDKVLQKFTQHQRQMGVSGTQITAIPKSACRKVTFWAVLPGEVKQNIAEGTLKPVVEVRSNQLGYSWNQGPPLAILTERANGVWKSEAYISKQQTDLEYKYALKDDRSQLVWEVLFQENNRTVKFCSDEEEEVIYDGAIIIDVNKACRQPLYNVITFTKANKVDRQAGYLPMLPQWSQEVQNGMSVNDLLRWVENATCRQLMAFLGGNSCPSSDELKNAHDDTFQILRKYVIDQAELLKLSLGSNGFTTDMILKSMLGLLHIVTRSWDLLLGQNQLTNTLSSLFEYIMKELIRRGAETTIEAVIQSWDSSIQRDFSQALLSAMRHMAPLEEQCHWVYMLPLYHWLSDANRNRGINFQKSDWWGTKNVEDILLSFKGCSHSGHSWRTWRIQLSPFFKADTVLPYTFLAMLDQQKLLNFLTCTTEHMNLPLDGVLASTRDHLMLAGKDYKSKQRIFAAVNSWLNRVKPLPVQNSEARELVTHLAKELLIQFQPATNFDSWKDSIVIAETYLHLSALVYSEEDKSLISKHFDPLQLSLLQSSNDSLKLIEHYPLLHQRNQEFLHWQDQFQCESSDTEVNQLWRRFCQGKFSSRLHQLKSPSDIANRVITGPGLQIPEMNTAAIEYLVSIPEWWLKEENRKYLEGPIGSGNLSSIFDKLLQQKWNIQDKDDMEIVQQMICNSESFLEMWNFMCILQNRTDVPSLSSGIDTMQHSIQCFTTAMNSILDETITLSDFDSLQRHMDGALELCNITELQPKKDELHHAFETLKRCYESYKYFLAQVSTLWISCKLSSIQDAEGIGEWRNRDSSQLKFRDTIQVSSGRVICEQIPDDIKKLLPKFCKCNQQRIFQEMLSGYMTEPDSWEEIVKIISRTMNHYDQIIQTISTGTIDVGSLKRLQKDHFDDSKEELLNQLPTMISDAEICRERASQIEVAAELDQYCNGAVALLEMREMFQLSGDFSDIEKLKQAEGNSLQLRQCNNNLTTSAGAVKGITEAQMDCLQAFVHKDCREFVEWVRVEVKEHDIRVFVDLIGATLGEGALATQQTRYLLNTLNGFSPLLYDLTPEKSDLKSFLNLCKEVWRNMDNNPDLASNLRWSASQVGQFKRVKVELASIEISTVSQATKINATGRYEIGNIHGHTTDFKVLDDVIRLTCILDEKTDPGTEDRHVYSFKDLTDLQSRLALVARDKEQQSADTIRQFEEMRDAVENLATAYIEIRREGCIQFDDMKVVVHCNVDQDLAIEVRLQSIGESMRGRKGEKDALKHCQDVYAYMKSCTERWRESMDEKRSDCQELNFFTTEQLVVLRKELGQFSCAKNSNCLGQAHSLLAMIHPVAGDELYTIITDYDKLHEDKEGDDGSNVRNYDKMSKKQKNLVRYIVGECPGIFQKEGVEAVYALGDKAARDLDKVKKWHADKLEAARLAGEVGDASDDVLTKLVSDSKNQDTLKKRLDLLWTKFIDHTSKSIKNFMGIPQLGYVLSKLMVMSDVPQLCRELPQWLERGKPALIGVESHLTYKMVLTMYAADPSFRFPTRNEVLICNKDTREEEVTLFLNRALNDPVSLYCMVNCHLIRYEACRIIETRLNSTADIRNRTYGLVFMYAKEAKDARIKSFLDKQLVGNCEPADDGKLKDYVQHLLTVPQTTRVTASCVDKDRSTTRLIRSSTAGVGKSLLKRKLCSQLRAKDNMPGKDITVPIHKFVHCDKIIARLTKAVTHDDADMDSSYDVIHLDIAHEVEAGVDELLFNLIILRSLVNSEGVVWQAKPTQYYIIECMPFTKMSGDSAHEVLEFLPTTMCVTPTMAYEMYCKNSKEHFIGFDGMTLNDPRWQLVLKHLICHSKEDFSYSIERIQTVTDKKEALRLLIKNCGLEKPTWAELCHYVSFLSSQLAKAKDSPFCQSYNADVLPGFKGFVVGFMLRMSKDFSTRSLMIAEETPGQNLNEVAADALLRNLSIKTTWEQKNYPYLFFNEDGVSLSTLGFHFKKESSVYVITDKPNGNKLDNYAPVTSLLHTGMNRQSLPFNEEFDMLPRDKQLTKLRNIMVKNVYPGQILFASDDDPDKNYVLTMDNAKKIIAIHQRLRVNIPVIVMGETGCGKTKLIEFMSKLQIPTALKDKIQTMEIAKIHGGTTEQDIILKVKRAQTLAAQNHAAVIEYALQCEILQIDHSTNEEDVVKNITEVQKLLDLNPEATTDYPLLCAALQTFGGATVEEIRSNFKLSKDKQAQLNYELLCKAIQAPALYTILFLDEVNTTEGIGLVKEMLCDHRMDGVDLRNDSSLKIIAACNPYRSHSSAMIKKLKTAGLGYNVGEKDSKDMFGKIPMRHLVYRVQALPQSLLPLIWDFGTLQSDNSSKSVEGEYIEKMITKIDETHKAEEIHFGGDLTKELAELLAMSQWFMRNCKEECSFVSLRDIQRLLVVANWFYLQRARLYPQMDDLTKPDKLIDAPNVDMDPGEQPTDVVRSILLAVGVCYLARLETTTRVAYAQHITGKIAQLMEKSAEFDGAKCLVQQVELCQDLFVQKVLDATQEKHANIAKNKSLKENVFMMIVCIENRIPLYVIGKPGSSKSLAKALVLDAMKGDTSRNEFFKEMKNTYMISFQCSRYATAAGIVNAFRQCASFQQKEDLDKFVSVVVLDEVGLAEDSENMPLKALHPLLEDGCVGDEEPEEYRKCAFIGISNWALDPAKMNRGIFIQIGSPTDDELDYIAREIYRSSYKTCADVERMIEYLTKAFQKIRRDQKPEGRDLTEFFGLRDFYSLIKMVVNFARRTGKLTSNQLEHSIKRNFGGFDPDSDFSPMGIFKALCSLPMRDTLEPSEDDKPATDSIGLIQQSLFGKSNRIDTRYLLILTENLSVLNIILDEFKHKGAEPPEVVFGSKFSDDVSYTQVCHNVYRIKMCMDLGKPVILLNLDDLYESLYDVLNQYFSTWGDKQFVDLGLGTHRVKAFVDNSFRLVLIADKNKVYSEFPIPLINRLEKHYMSATSLLDPNEKNAKEKLEAWMRKFIRPSTADNKACPIHCEACPAVLRQPYRLPCKHYVGECCRQRIKSAAKCVVEDCKSDVDQTFEWNIDVKALDSRQYFETIDVTSSIIGYSTEMVALVVNAASKEVMAERSKFQGRENFPQLIYEKAKEHLMQCATAESVLRLDRTFLHAEASQIQHWYIAEQQHEDLLQYLALQLPASKEQTLLIQVTTFAELMNSEHIKALEKDLNFGEAQYHVESLFLKTYNKESLFTHALRRFYEKQSPDHTKLLVIQCEAAQENVDLLDSVRYIIQRETAAVDMINYTILLLSLARGVPFNGYQGGGWICVHIDDPRSPQFKLPSLKKCLTMQPRELISNVLQFLNQAKVVRAASSNALDDDADDENESDNDEDIPALADTDAELEEYPDMELIAEPKVKRPVAATKSQYRDDSEDILRFLKQHCLSRALSVVKCDESSYNSIGQLKKHFNNKGFQETFVTHVHNLLEEQDKANYHLTEKGKWVKSDAAKASNMKKSETLRHALEDSLERAFRPAIAAVIAFIAPQANLHLLDTRPQTAKLWLEIFFQSDKLELNYERLTKVAPGTSPTSRLPNSYLMLQSGFGPFKAFHNRFPFCWLVKESIDPIMMVPRNTTLMKDDAGNWLSEPFKKTVVGAILDEAEAEEAKALTEEYLHDFVYMTHPCTTVDEHWIIEQTLLRHMNHKFQNNIAVTQTHIIYDKLRTELLNLSAILCVDAESLELEKEDGDTEIVFEVKRQVEEILLQVHQGKVELNTEETAMDAGSEAASAEDQESLTKNEEDGDDAETDDVQLEFPEEIPTEDDLVLPSRAIKRVDVIALRVLIAKLYDISLLSIQTNPELWVNHVDQCKLLMEKILDFEVGYFADKAERSARSEWTTLELKKLYVEHVIMPSKVDQRHGTRPPHKILAFFTESVEAAEYHKKCGFDEVVASFRMIVGEGVRELYENCEPGCPGCKKPIGVPSKLAACGHFLCATCLDEQTMCAHGGCKEEVSKTDVLHPANDNLISPEKLSKYEEFRGGLNQFFMHFVSELVFKSGVAPEIEIVDWLSDHVTFRDGEKKFDLFKNEVIVNPTDVLRSFLIKLLLQCQDNMAISDHLNRLIVDLGKSENQQERLQNFTLLMSCQKDLNYHIVQDYAQQDLIQSLHNHANRYSDTVSGLTQPTLSALIMIADLHCLLSRAVDDFHQLQERTELTSALQTLIEVVQASNNPQVGYFIVRQLLNMAGEGYIKDLIHTRHRSVIPRDIQAALATFSIPDVFAMFEGDEYEHLKAVVDAIIGESDKGRCKTAIRTFFQECHQNLRLILHILFNRVTRSFIDNVPVHKTVCEQILKVSTTLFTDSTAKKLLELLLVQGEFPAEMDMRESRGIHLTMLVIHIFTSVSGCTPKQDLYPLKEIMLNPEQAAAHFIPTMADNQLEALFYENQRIHGRSLVPYRCSCGMIYFIGECGRAWTTSICPQCKKKIGGALHELHKDDTRLDLSAIRSKPGHILGEVAKRAASAIGERQLSAVSCAVLRALTHLSMFASMLLHPDKLLGMFNPKLKCKEDIGPFLDAHLQMDLKQIAECCENSTDDCILLLHNVIDNLRKGVSNYQQLDCCTLKNFTERKDWENDFDNKYIRPTFDNKEACLLNLKDHNQPESLQEILSTTQEPINGANFVASAGLWEYSRPLTVPSILNKLDSKEQYPALKSIVQNCDTLIVVKHLPDILHLVRVICTKFHSQLTRAQSKETPVLDFIARHFPDLGLPSQKLEKMVQSFVKAWNYAITSNKSGMDKADALTSNPKLFNFLIDRHDKYNSNPLKLIRFLVEAHNNIISQGDEERASVPLSMITPSSLVSLSSKDTLFSLLAAHNERTTSAELQYNWEPAEHEAKLRFVGARMKIEFDTKTLPLYMFQDDFNLWAQINALRETQEKLSEDIQESVASAAAHRSIQTLTTYLMDLNIAINYLSVMPSFNAETPLIEFMQTTVNKTPEYLHRGIHVKHILSVWTIIKYAQADALMHNKQEPFDDIAVDYIHDIPDGAEAIVKEKCAFTSPPTKMLMMQLFKFIILRLNKEAVAADIIDSDAPLHTSLLMFVYQNNMEGYAEIEGSLPELPLAILVRHASQMWKCIWKRYTTPAKDADN